MKKWFLEYMDYNDEKFVREFNSKEELVEFASLFCVDEEILRVIYGEEVSFARKMAVKVGDPAE